MGQRRACPARGLPRAKAWPATDAQLSAARQTAHHQCVAFFLRSALRDPAQRSLASCTSWGILCCRRGGIGACSELSTSCQPHSINFSRADAREPHRPAHPAISARCCLCFDCTRRQRRVSRGCLWGAPCLLVRDTAVLGKAPGSRALPAPPCCETCCETSKMPILTPRWGELLLNDEIPAQANERTAFNNVLEDRSPL